MRYPVLWLSLALPLTVFGAADVAAVVPEAAAPGASAPTAVEAAVVPSPALPVAPVLSGRAVSAVRAEFSWTDCQLANQPDAGFALQVKTPLERDWRVVRSVGPGLLSVGVDGLAPETQYEFRVWASNAAGTTGSNVFSLTMPVDDAVAAAMDALRARNIYASGVGQASSLLLMAAPDVVAQVTPLSTRAQLLSGNAVVVPGLVSSTAGRHSFVLQMGGAPMAATEAVGGMAAGVNFEAVDRLSASADVEVTPAMYTANLDGVAGGEGVSSVESYRPVPFVAKCGWRVACRAQVGGDNAVYVPLIVVSAEPKTLRMRVVGEWPAHADYLPNVTRQEPEIEVFAGETRVAFAPEAVVAGPVVPEAAAGQPAPTAEALSVAMPVHEVRLTPVLAKGVYTVRIAGKVAKPGPVLIEISSQD